MVDASLWLWTATTPHSSLNLSKAIGCLYLKEVVGRLFNFGNYQFWQSQSAFLQNFRHQMLRRFGMQSVGQCCIPNLSQFRHCRRDRLLAVDSNHEFFRNGASDAVRPYTPFYACTFDALRLFRVATDDHPRGHFAKEDYFSRPSVGAKLDFSSYTSRKRRFSQRHG